MFLSPIFLIAGAIGAAIPLVLHLMQNRKRERMPFPTLRFLRLAQKQSSRRARMENYLLWLIRTAIMVLIGLAFSMPMFRSKGFAWLGDAPRDVAIVIDASYSMGYNTGRDTVWKKSLATATALVEGLGDNDRFCLFLAREQPEALIAEPVSDKEQGLARIKALLPGTGSSQLAPAVSEALAALEKAGGSREREIYILTDSQALPWESFGQMSAPAAADAAADAPSAATSAAWDPGTVDPRTSFFVAMLGVPAPENIAPDSIALQPALLRKGMVGKAITGIARTGQAAETSATLFINGEQIARRHIRFDAPEGSAPVFSLPALPPGTHAARIDTPEDNLPEDNSFHFLIRVEDRLPALVVGSPEDTLFIRTAIRTGVGGSASEPIEPTPASEIAAQQLGDYACVFLCNALPVSGQSVLALENYVKAGGLLVLFPGMGADVDAYKPWTCLPAVPASTDDIAWSRRAATLTWERPDHPLVRPLRLGASIPNLTVRRKLAWGDLHPSAEPLIGMGAEQPFLLERPFGKGRVLMFAVAADRTWSDFPLSPFYLPTILQCVDYGAGFGSWSPFIWATTSLPLSESVPGATKGSTLRGPDGSPTPVRSTVVEGRTVLTAEDLTRPGIYEIESPDRPLARPALAVNLPRRESDLTPLPPESVRERLGVARVALATNQEELDALIQEHRVGRTYGEHLLWLAFLLVIVEFCYANSLNRAAPRLSDDLKIDPSGHVRGHG